MFQLPFKNPKLLPGLLAILLFVLVATLVWAMPARAGELSGDYLLILKAPAQQNQLTPTPYPLIEPTPEPYPVDERPVERNPYLVAGGVLVFAVIMLATLLYSRRKTSEE